MSEKSVEAAAELSAKDLKEKKEKVEEKAGRKERKKEVVEVWRPQAEDGPTLSQRPSYLLLPSWGCGGPAFLLIPPSFFPYPASFLSPSGWPHCQPNHSPCLGTHRRRRMELRRKKKKLLRMEKMMMKEMKKMRKKKRRRMKAQCERELLKRRMKQIPRDRRQKMGRRHEPLPVGLGMGGPSGPGGGAGTHTGPLLLAPCSGPAPEL